MPGPPLHDVPCVIHVHSTHSDGSPTVAELAATARATGVKAVLLTDHDTLAARRTGEDGWQDGVLVVVGHEVSTRKGHLLAFGLDEEAGPKGAPEPEVAERVLAAGGVAFGAHAWSRGVRLAPKLGPPHPWPAQDTPGIGVELWSVQTDAAEHWRSPLEAARWLANPRKHLDGPPTANLQAWDRLSAERRVAAVGGLDAHENGKKVAGRMLTPLPNRRFFALLRTHAHLDAPLTGTDAAADERALLAALGEGRAHIGVDGFADTTGFDLWAESADGAIAPMGAEVQAADGPWTLRVTSPQPARLSLRRDGDLVASAHGTALEHVAEGAGAYRVEARLAVDGGPERVWVLTNPVHLR